MADQILFNKVSDRSRNLYGEDVRIAILKEEVEVFRSRIEPHDTGHLYTTIGTLEHRIEELDNDDEDYPDYIAGSDEDPYSG